MTKVDNYWILLQCGNDDSAIIGYLPDDVPPKRKLKNNKKILDQFPEITNLEFNEDYPDNIKLYDFVDNTMSLLIVSERVKSVFDDQGIDLVEYIPVNIYDHQQNLAGENYFIINILNIQPIIDMKKSKYKMSRLQKDQIQFINDLHLNLDSVDPEAKLFKASNEKVYHYITNEVLEALKNSGITGIRAVKAEGWDGNTLSFL